jgi:hypothetical protein
LPVLIEGGAECSQHRSLHFDVIAVRREGDAGFLSVIAEIESKLALLKARRGALNSVSQFMESASQPSGLLSHIEALEHSVSSGGSTSATRSAASMKQQATYLFAS